MSRLRKEDWRVADVERDIALRLVRAFHYAKGGSNTGVYIHGLFRADAFFDGECLGVAWWIPPTRVAAAAVHPDNPEGVLVLSRLVIAPEVPANACTFLLARSRKLIDRAKWPVLLTYADEGAGHTGAIYRADNWDYQGTTKPEAVYMKGEQMVARKAGPKTRTHAEMLALGARLARRTVKHRFVRIGR